MSDKRSTSSPWTTLRAAFSQVGATWLLSLWLASAASAQSPAPAGEGRRGPPAEALAACQSLSSGQACSFSGQRGTVAGTCFAPQDRPLACRPKDPPSPPHAGASGPKR